MTEKTELETVKEVIDSMPNGMDGFLKTWGLQQFGLTMLHAAVDYGMLKSGVEGTSMRDLWRKEALINISISMLSTAVDKKLDVSFVGGAQPTHSCKVCGAMWRRNADGTWNLRSKQCGKCCDNAEMTGQIVPMDDPRHTSPPNGYAYKYPGQWGGIRFNDGATVNGSKPTASIPYWFGAAISHKRCAGLNCSSDGMTPHSEECVAEHEQSTGGGGDEKAV